MRGLLAFSLCCLYKNSVAHLWADLADCDKQSEEKGKEKMAGDILTENFV